MNKWNKCIGVLQNDYHGNLLQVVVIFHIVSNALFLSYSLAKSSPHSGNSKVLIGMDTRMKTGEKKILVWPCTILFSAHRKVVWLFEVLVGGNA